MGIKKKLFIISTGIVVASSILIYITLFALFPKIYTNTKINNIKKQTEDLITKMSSDYDYNYEEGINRYSYEQGAVAVLLNGEGQVIYAPNKFERNIMKDHMVVSELKRGIFKNRKTDYEFTLNVYVKSINQDCILKVSVPLGFQKDIHKVIIILFPIILVITILLGLLSVFVYGKVISNPLLKINSVAKEIASLDFTKNIEVKGNDEFSELSNSINMISNNLKENISMLEKANRELKNDIEKEKLLDKRRRDFINAISHELKTPITAISGQIEGMIYNIGAYKNRDKYLKETLESVSELNALVHEIIALAKVEEGDLSHKEDIILNSLIMETLNGYEYFIKEKKLRVSIEEKAVLEKMVDKGIMKKILSNIIGNAVKYSRSFMEITIDENTIEVKNDMEILFDKGEEKEIFKAFYRVDKSRNKEKGGTGLGLYIVKSLVELHSNLSYKVEVEGHIFKFKIIMN